MLSTTTTRRPKWHPTPPPPPSPKILNLPRRTRRRQPRKAAAKLPVQRELRGEHYRGRLESLFDQERTFSRTAPVVLLNSVSDVGERREKVLEDCGGGFVEEKWRFQAEILRAECNFLRMEREFALKKLERNRVQMERTLRSAVQTLVSGRKKIFEGKNVNAVLEEEIVDLVETLEELQRSFSGIKEFGVQHCSNFDKKASLLQRRLEKLGGLSNGKCVKEIREMAEASFSIGTKPKVHEESLAFVHKSNNKFSDVEVLRRKMEGLSKGLLDRMEEECRSMTSTTANSSASTSKRIEFHDSSSSCARQPHQEPTMNDENKCSGHCKAIVRKIVEQVRAEMEQWSQMQEMLGQVRDEMEELQASRDFWEEQTLDAEYEIKSLRSTVKQWRQKALTLETKANELQAEISTLRGELEKLRKERNGEVTGTKDMEPISLGAQIAKEKHVLLCRLKENRHPSNKAASKQLDISLTDGRRNGYTCSCESDGLPAPKRSPLQNIGNSSPKPRQNSKAIFPVHFP